MDISPTQSGSMCANASCKCHCPGHSIQIAMEIRLLQNLSKRSSRHSNLPQKPNCQCHHRWWIWQQRHTKFNSPSAKTLRRLKISPPFCSRHVWAVNHHHCSSNNDSVGLLFPHIHDADHIGCTGWAQWFNRLSDSIRVTQIARLCFSPTRV